MEHNCSTMKVMKSNFNFVVVGDGRTSSKVVVNPLSVMTQNKASVAQNVYIHIKPRIKIIVFINQGTSHLHCTSLLACSQSPKFSSSAPWQTNCFLLEPILKHFDSLVQRICCYFPAAKWLYFHALSGCRNLFWLLLLHKDDFR